jgi:hypothetical protein
MRKALLILCLILFIGSIQAIKINEVELNPSGEDSGNEWVEFYHPGDFNLEGCKLVNNDGDELILSGSFSKYYIYTFEKQWLDNSDEKVFLYKKSELVDETDLFEDNKNNDLTWQLCDGDWKFAESTKGKKNDCKEKDEEKENENVEEKETEEVETIFEDIENKIIESETIKLNTKDIKSKVDKKNLDKSDYAKYGFVIFCVLLGFLFMFKKRKFKKNELA